MELDQNSDRRQCRQGGPDLVHLLDGVQRGPSNGWKPTGSNFSARSRPMSSPPNEAIQAFSLVAKLDCQALYDTFEVDRVVNVALKGKRAKLWEGLREKAASAGGHAAQG